MERKIVNNKLRLMVFESAFALGEKVDEHLLEKYHLNKEDYTFMLPIKESFFEDGHLKVEILNTVRGKEIFALTDIGNYSLTYNMHGFTNHTSPQDLIMQLKDGIGACNSHVPKINILMPLLYAGRQHRRNTMENLLCGMVLRELDMNRHLKSIITFDAHDPGVEHAIQNTEFDNVFPSNVILEKFIHDVDKENLLYVTTVAPDNGANGRRNIILNSLNSDYIMMEAGSFYKQRDYNRIVNGLNPIISHDYCGNADLKGKTAIIVDDMISSGGSILDCMDELKKRGVEKIYVIVTYALFTKGIDKFKKHYKDGKFDRVYTTNLSYIPEEYQKERWLRVCDCSKIMADLIYNIHNDLSISDILRDKSAPMKLLEKKFDQK